MQKYTVNTEETLHYLRSKQTTHLRIMFVKPNQVSVVGSKYMDQFSTGSSDVMNSNEYSTALVFQNRSSERNISDTHTHTLVMMGFMNSQDPVRFLVEATAIGLRQASTCTHIQRHTQYTHTSRRETHTQTRKHSPPGHTSQTCNGLQDTHARTHALTCHTRCRT